MPEERFVYNKKNIKCVTNSDVYLNYFLRLTVNHKKFQIGILQLPKETFNINGTLVRVTQKCIHSLSFKT